jgi:hypothetical protein
MSWMTRFAKARVPVAMLLALTACGGGCQSSDKDDVAEGRAGEDFLRDDETSAVTRIAERQTAAGARTDATLRPYHFNHARLNSLGREKLDFILADRGEDGVDGETVVYVDVEGDEANRQHADARRAAVTDYLASRGMSEGSYRLESGFNPHNTMSVVSALPPEKTDAAAADAAAAHEGAGDAAALQALTDMMPKR